MGEIYHKDGKFIRIDNCNRFIYEVSLYVKYQNIYSMINHKYFSSNIEIPNVIDQININNNITIYCEIYSAPKSWIIDNEYVLYVKPEKKKRIKKQKNESKSMST